MCDECSNKEQGILSCGETDVVPRVENEFWQITAAASVAVRVVQVFAKTKISKDTQSLFWEEQKSFESDITQMTEWTERETLMQNFSFF